MQTKIYKGVYAFDKAEKYEVFLDWQALKEWTVMQPQKAGEIRVDKIFKYLLHNLSGFVMIV